ncbi:hypothetical protein G3I77_25765 [Streptomyces sp. D2-8]|uniref:hypothetical protein n=1 Tax=Streptomyces sp. D2-8 TaxID=2707767 RepID=UPI0035AF1476|nr:hypothetical protein [Streptomyces sp. D2-8]
MATDVSEDRQRWHERRLATVSVPYGPHGPLALIGAHWLGSYPDGRLPDIPGSWRADGDPGLASRTRVVYGERRLVVLMREGAWGVRDFDPESSARRAFRGLRVTP